MQTKLILTLITLLLYYNLPAQKTLSISEMVALAMERNPAVHAAALQVTQQQTLRGTAFDLPKTNFSVLYGQYNSIHDNDNNISVSQSIPFPSVISGQRGLWRSREANAKAGEQLVRAELTARVRSAFNRALYFSHRARLLQRQDSLLARLVHAANLQYRVGEENMLRLTSVQTQKMEVENAMRRNEIDLQVELDRLRQLTQEPALTSVAGGLQELFSDVDVDFSDLGGSPRVQLGQRNVDVLARERKVESARALPEFEIGYFNQSLIGSQLINGNERFFDGSTRFEGFQIGLSLPLFFTPHRSRIKAASYAVEVAEKQLRSVEIETNQELISAGQSLEKNKMSVSYYEKTALPHADLLTTQSNIAFRAGEVDYILHLFNLQQALTIRERYLESLMELNENIIRILLITGK